MKKIILSTLLVANTLNANISFKNLYGNTAVIAGSLAGAGYLFSRLCQDEANAPYVQGAFGILGMAAGTYYYRNWHPEARMYNNQNNFNSAKNNDLLALLVNSLDDSELIIRDSFIQRLSIHYIELRNPYYNAFQDILMLKRQGEAILNESRLLLNFYNLYAYKNEEYCKILEQQVIETKLIIELVTNCLALLKNTQEYKEALALQIEIEKQESLEKMARAQQTQAINSYARPSTVIVHNK